MAVLAHLGVAQAPAWLFAREIADGSVVRLLKEYEQPKPIYVVRPGGRRPAAKVKVFIEFLENTLAESLEQQLLKQ
jgi:LysR family transcriptional regulator for bpeEF and oprC